jgi:hypothetical protein
MNKEQYNHSRKEAMIIVSYAHGIIKQMSGIVGGNYSNFEDVEPSRIIQLFDNVQFGCDNIEHCIAKVINEFPMEEKEN